MTTATAYPYTMRATQTTPAPMGAPLVPLNGLFNWWLTHYQPRPLIEYLNRYFKASTVMVTLSRYLVTGDPRGRVCYWQTNGGGVATSGRCEGLTAAGTVDHTAPPTWAHAQAKRAGKLPDEYQPPKYPFGLHLVTDGARVLMVESEAAALLLACYNLEHPNNSISGQYSTIMAAGGEHLRRVATSNAAKILQGYGAAVTHTDDTAAQRLAAWLEAERQKRPQTNEHTQSGPTAHRRGVSLLTVQIWAYDCDRRNEYHDRTGTPPPYLSTAKQRATRYYNHLFA